MTKPGLQLVTAGVIAPLVILAAACAGSAPRSGAGLDEVSVGYGVQDRRDVTGAISSIDADDIAESGEGRLEDVLRDRVPGLQISRMRNGDVSIRIRGTRSLLATNEPLIVVDGMALNRAASVLSMLAPASIARVDVLKDAGATAAYGSRGANGVILITTKRGN